MCKRKHTTQKARNRTRHNVYNKLCQQEKLKIVTVTCVG